MTIQGSPTNDPANTFTPKTALQRPGLLLLDGVVYAGSPATATTGPTSATSPASTRPPRPPCRRCGRPRPVANDRHGRHLAVRRRPGLRRPRPHHPRHRQRRLAGARPRHQPARHARRVGDPAAGQRRRHADRQGLLQPVQQQPTSTRTTPTSAPAARGAAGRLRHHRPPAPAGADRQGRPGLPARPRQPRRHAQGAGRHRRRCSGRRPVQRRLGPPRVLGRRRRLRLRRREPGLAARSSTASTAAAARADPAGTSPSRSATPPVSPVVTSDGTTSGSAIVWVVYSDGSNGANGQLRAYDALPVERPCTLRYSAPIGTATKFVAPRHRRRPRLRRHPRRQIFGFGRPTTAALPGLADRLRHVAVGSTGTATVTVTGPAPVTVSGVSTSAPFTTAPARCRAASPPARPDRAGAFTPAAAGAISGALTFTTGAGTSRSTCTAPAPRTAWAPRPRPSTSATSRPAVRDVQRRRHQHRDDEHDDHRLDRAGCAVQRDRVPGRARPRGRCLGLGRREVRPDRRRRQPRSWSPSRRPARSRSRSAAPPSPGRRT